MSKAKKLTRAEKQQINAAIQNARRQDKRHKSAQDSIPFQRMFPDGMVYKVTYDVTEFLYASIEEVVKTLILTLVLVFFVVYVFLQDMRSTLIPAIAIPVALIATFFVLKVISVQRSR